MKKFIFVLMISIICVMLVSCASTQKTADILDLETYQLPVLPNDSTAVVYVVRAKKAYGAWIPFKVSIDDSAKEKLNNASVITYLIQPGEHTFIAKGENTKELPFTAEAGHVYFYEVFPKMGFIYARVRIDELDEISGKNKVMKYYEEGKSSVINLATNPVSQE
ncbi:hypothetical protein J6W78_08140 [bacterium]|nr:hypothetical protein [bacterium]